ncbi:uncharacterized protein LOC101237623 isoform X2 [Hydra vulgaris]|uniref:Uncharacterized protein LOC101237623 isoform X2 n=1 Tax=Hydra vulgaris TaxID=6087 RepID=A0ABM4BND3_HYDVU
MKFLKLCQTQQIFERFILMADNVENPITHFSPFNGNNKGELTRLYDANKLIQLFKIKNGFETQKNNSMNSVSSFLLHQAAIEGSIDQVKLLIKEYSYNIEDIDCINLQGCTPLHLASRFNRLKVVEYLLENGSQINKTTEVENNTPLLLATKYNMTDTAKYLCEHGADVKIKNIHGSTALHLAASKGNEEICNALIQNGSDINAIDSRNCTPLHMAIHGGSKTITKLLIENGADVYAKDAEGEGPIHYAAAMNQGELIILLTKGALAIVDEENWEETQRKYVNLRTKKKDAALHIAAREGYLDIVKTLVSIGANVNICSAAHYTPLHLAAINGNKDMVQYLLEHNAKINVFDHQNMTPTHNMFFVCRACQFGRLDIIKVLIEQGAQIDSKDCDSFTPLMSAVSEGHSDAAKYLLKCGASVAISEMNMKNVLHLAIENGHSSTLKVLLQNGSSSLINSHDMDFKRPIHYAAMSNFESVKILIQESADTEVTDNEEKTPLHIAAEYGKVDCLLILVKNSTRNINCTDEKGQSPLHLAAKNGWTDTSLVLIEMGAQISGRDDSNWSPLDYAARNGHSKIVIALIKNGACVNEYDPNKLTPLHHASINGHVKCINILLNHGANISFQNADGKNCLDLALENHHTEACRIFVTHKRWKEVLNNIDNEGSSPMEKLISYAPDIAQIVLDKCIEYSKLDENSKGYYIRYDFKYLDSHPENSSKRIYFGPSCMITFKQENLLSHPLTVQLINYKWSCLGRWIHLISLFIYILFVGMLTGLLIIDKEREKQEEKNGFQKIIPTVILILSSFEICKEFVQAYLLKKEYFKDFNNYLELILYSSTFIFMLSFIKHITMNIKWTAGVFSILFAWTNLLLYLKRSFFGVYVVMIIEILKSLINVIMVFVMIIIAFSLSFFVLFENSSFSSPEWSMVKTIVMTLGETDFNDLFINNNTTVDISDLPYPEMSYILFTLFLIVCPIVLMNLLVGLAVGNIAYVRDSAYILMLKAQVDILKALESRYPKKLLKKTYHDILTVYPNTVSWKKSFFQLFGIADFNSLKDKQESRSKWKTNIARDLELEHIEFDHLEKRIETIKMLMRKHLEITEDIIVTLKIDENLFLSKHLSRTMRQTTQKKIRKQLTQFEKRQIVAWHESGYTDHEIGKKLNRWCTTTPRFLFKLQWVKQYQNWTIEQWKNVLWSDESPFCLYYSGRSRVWRLHNERYNPLVTQPTVKHDKKVNVWGCFTSADVGRLYKIPGIMDTVLSWPAQSPDLNPIKNLWSILDHGIKTRAPKNEKELFQILQNQWKNISGELLQSLVESMPRLCKAVIKTMSLTNQTNAKHENNHDDYHDDNNICKKYSRHDDKRIDLHGDIYSKERSNRNCKKQEEVIPLECNSYFEETDENNEKKDKVLKLDSPDQNNSNYQTMLKLLKSPKISLIRLLHLKPRVEDEQDGLISPNSHKTPELFPGCEDELNDKGKATVFNIPKCLFDFSNEKFNIFTKSYMSEFDKDSSRFSLHLAAKEGAIERIRYIIEECKRNNLVSSKEFVNVRDKLNEKGFSALHLAARYNNAHVVAYLLENGALIDSPDRDDGNTPLLLAAKYKKTNTAVFLIEKGANALIRNYFGTTALHYASRRGDKKLVIKILKIPFVNINVEDDNLATPLHLAMNDGCKQVVNVLIKNGANVLAKNNKGERPIHNAASSNADYTRDYIVSNQISKKIKDFQHVPSSIAEDLIELLLRGALQNVSTEDYRKQKNDYVNSRTNEYYTPLHFAARCGNEKSLNKLIRIGGDVNAQTNTGSTPLHLAAISGHERVVNMLITYKANIQAVDKDLMTPLHRACQFGRLSVVRLLDEKRAILDVNDKKNYTPVMCAIWKGHLEVIKYLIGQGVQINSTDINNKNGIHIALKENQIEVIKFLLDNDQFNKMNSVDKNNRAPVHYAALNGNSQALQLLINKNAPIDIGDNQEKTPLHLASEFGHLHCVKLLISTSPGDVNSTDACGMTPLHLAVLNDRRDVIRLLIVSGANVYLRDNLDWSSLDYAAQNGKEKCLYILLNGLLKKDYVNASDKNRYTPLHHAATEGHVECINLLLEHGANVQLQTNENKNCLYLAVENLQKEACMAIMQHERWHEALISMDNSGTHVMKKMIELTPEVGEKALDNCIICSKLDIKNPDYSVEYNFEFIDKDPMNPDNSFFAPLLMVKYKREKLLSHPLVVELINQKWSRMGQWIYLCSLCFYLIFVSFLTTLVILERINSKSEFPHPCNNHENHFAVVISWLTLSIACIQIFFKLVLAAYIGRSYIFDPVKLLEFFLYTSTALFMVSFVACKYNIEAMKRQSGSVSILLAWSKLMLYLENLPFLGLYFVMFTEVLYTFLKVLLVFSILLIGFGLSFFTLLHNQQPFSGYIRSIVKTFVMMLGELTYGSTFEQENKKAHNEDLSLIIFLLFAIIMVIVVMNLLVGLAVGDIESVRKNAYLRVLQRKVYYLNILDRTYPKFIQKFVYQKSYTKKPNIKSWYEKLMLWMGIFHQKGIEEKHFNAKKELIMREILSNKEALLKQKQNTKLILYDLKNQIKKTKKIAKSISQNSNVQNFFD